MQKVCDRQALSVQVTLPNGLRIFLLEDHEVPIVHGNLLMRGGQRASPSNKVSPTAPPHALVEREKFTSPFSQPGLCRQDCVHAWAFCSMLRCQSSLPSCVLCHVSVPVGESINKALVHKRDQPVSMWTPAVECEAHGTLYHLAKQACFPAWRCPAAWHLDLAPEPPKLDAGARVYPAFVCKLDRHAVQLLHLLTFISAMRLLAGHGRAEVWTERDAHVA